MRKIRHIRFREEAIFGMIRSGVKTVETRALNPDEPDRYFGDIKPGDLLECEFVKTGEVIGKLIKDARIYTDFERYLKQEKLCNVFGFEVSPLAAKKIHFSFPGYKERLTKHGIVAIELESQPAIDISTVKIIGKHINDQFFDSLRLDYPKFNQWFAEKCLKENRLCALHLNHGELDAIIILKKELPEEHGLLNIDEPVTKVCTFKVSDNASGAGLGTLLTEYAEAWSSTNGIRYLYLTVPMKSENDHTQLLHFLGENGFRRIELRDGSVTNNDQAYIKEVI